VIGALGLEELSIYQCSMVTDEGVAAVFSKILIFRYTWDSTAALESSIFVGESRGLGHSNRLLTTRILAIGNILKALKMGFFGFLSCFGTHFYAVL
jgi:hypothetical protein